ncbi:MAG: lamin tail domain-containing protein [Bacteroidales bacterium]|nr:lamin tail domain-containing protein [Bacteroidales bacterium]
MKIIKPIILIVVLLPFSVWGQISESFNEGDSAFFYWFGTPEKFIINSKKQLQLYDTAAGIAWLSTADHISGSNEWSFWIKEAFSPSSGNFTRIYLQSDQQNLTSPLNGYFLQFGETGGADAVELFRQDGDRFVSICRGHDSLIASSFEISIKVIRDSLGNWQLLADPLAGNLFLPQTTGFDNQYMQGNYFGIYCAYTKSNARKIYLDNVYSGPVIHDTIRPDISTVQILNNRELAVVFSEPMNKVLAENTAHYLLFPVEKDPEKAELLHDGKTVLLRFETSFQNKTHYVLKIDSIADLFGNMVASEETAFDYYLPEAYDVVINEIMADPTPSQGLPEAEYLELYNTTDFDIDLSEWKLILGSKIKQFDQALIRSKGYLILTAEKNREDFQSFGPVYGFSSFSLLNSGQNLVLKDSTGITISEVNYQDSWYGSSEKENGGWSLEQINPANSCSGAENWKASIDTIGGTPGSKNSVYDTLVLFPKLKTIQIVGNQNIEVFFNQKMDSFSLLNRDLWFAESHPDSIFISDDSLQKASLFFANSFEKSKKYELQVSGLMKNCRGLPIVKDTFVFFGLPEPIAAKDVLFNELLVQPRSGGAEYIELVNHSEKIIDLSELLLGIQKNHNDGSIDTVFYTLSEMQKLCFPGEYYVLTKYPEKVKEQYVTESPDNFIAMTSFPVLTNEKGTVILKAMDNGVIDGFTYNEKMHYSLLKRTDGVSMERSSLEKNTEDLTNWHSASEDYGFGTPTGQNSQFVSSEDAHTSFAVEPKIFSPDGDGFNDKLSIKYQLNTTGYSVNIHVFNRSGVLIRHLYENEYLGTTGKLYWNGKTDQNTTALPGIYIVYIQLFNVDGTTKQMKMSVVVALK